MKTDSKNGRSGAARIGRAVWIEVLDWVQAIVGSVPGRIGRTIRGPVLHLIFPGVRMGCVIGENCRFTGKRITAGRGLALVERVTFVANDGVLSLGENVYINRNVLIDASGGEIFVGDDCLIGPNVVLRASNHGFDDLTLPIREQKHRAGTIRVGANVWIGANAVLLAGVSIGEGAVIAAGAVVTKDIPARAIAAGVPARVLRTRGE